MRPIFQETERLLELAVFCHIPWIEIRVDMDSEALAKVRGFLEKPEKPAFVRAGMVDVPGVEH